MQTDTESPVPRIRSAPLNAPLLQTLTLFFQLRSLQPSVVGTMGTGGTLYPSSSGLVPPVPPSQRCGLCQNFKQTTLTTRLYKVRTNLYPPTRLLELGA